MGKMRLLFISLSAVAFGLFVAVAAMAWTSPSGAPPTGSGAIYYSGGNVGIGTSTPSVKLEVQGGYIKTTDAVGAPNTSKAFMEGATGVSYFGSFSTQRASFGNSESWETLTADGGNIGIGTTSMSEKLVVNGNVSATSFIYSSDRNLKENIIPLSDSLDKISQLSGVSFSWRETGEESIGLIAQDVEKVYPELVTTDSFTGLKSLNYAGLIAPLIETVKKQQLEINSLKEQLELLKK